MTDLHALVVEIELRVVSLPDCRTPALRSLRREYSRRIKPLLPDDVIAIATARIGRRLVPRIIGDELRPDALATLNLAHLERLGASISELA